MTQSYAEKDILRFDILRFDILRFPLRKKNPGLSFECPGKDI
jgi:hypothetical protein